MHNVQLDSSSVSTSLFITHISTSLQYFTDMASSDHELEDLPPAYTAATRLSDQQSCLPTSSSHSGQAHHIPADEVSGYTLSFPMSARLAGSLRPGIGGDVSTTTPIISEVSSSNQGRQPSHPYAVDLEAQRDDHESPIHPPQSSDEGSDRHDESCSCCCSCDDCVLCCRCVLPVISALAGIAGTAAGIADYVIKKKSKKD